MASILVPTWSGKNLASLTPSRAQRHIRVAGRLYDKGRTRVVWVNGVLFFGGCSFLFYTAVAYFLDPRPPRDLRDYAWIAFWLVLCLAVGYLRGLATWRSLVRLFS